MDLWEITFEKIHHVLVGHLSCSINMVDLWPFSADLGQGDPLELCALSPVVPNKGARLKTFLKEIFKCSTKAQGLHTIKGTQF